MKKDSDARARFEALLATDDVPLAEAALAVAAEEYPALDPGLYLARLNALATRVRIHAPEPARAGTLLMAIRTVLYGEERFRGNDEDYYDPRNSFFNEVSFRETPFAPHSALNGALGRDAGALWIKDETGNVSASHKARHLMGLAIWLEVARRTGMLPSETSAPPLSIASCGNAALAAAVVAKAAHRQLDVFIPTDAHPNVTHRLAGLGSRLTVCRREGSTPGDPCVVGFRESLTRGALPFSVQGNENGLAIEGGLTLAYEIVSSLLRSGSSVDRLFVQVGGGALASSCVQALRDAANLGLIERMPKIHAVQTEGAYPLRRAWERLVAQVLGERLAFRIEKRDSAADAARATAVLSPAIQPKRREAIRFAATHRSKFMWPWESVPHSVAHGILDDETYDWLAIVEAMVDTGGWPIVVSEDDLRETNDIAARSTTIPADHTGTAGLAGALRLVRDGVIAPAESLAALFTGRRR